MAERVSECLDEWIGVAIDFVSGLPFDSKTKEFVNPSNAITQIGKIKLLSLLEKWISDIKERPINMLAYESYRVQELDNNEAEIDSLHLSACEQIDQALDQKNNDAMNEKFSFNHEALFDKESENHNNSKDDDEKKEEEQTPKGHHFFTNSSFENKSSAEEIFFILNQKYEMQT